MEASKKNTLSSPPTSDASMNTMTRLGDPSYTSDLSSGLNQLRLEGTWCDITITVANQRFQAHKAVLIASSDYFRGMFASEFQEKDSSEVTLQGRADVFSQLLEFAYTGYFHLSAANAWSVLKMASYMNFSQAINVCKEYLIQHVDDITIEDAYDIITFGEIQGDLSDMLQRFHTRLLHNFPRFFESKTILDQATKEFVMACLEDENIETDDTTEEEILEGVLNWLKHDWEQRKIHTVVLLQKIRLGLVPAERLTELLSVEFLAYPECKQMVDEVARLRANKKITDIPLNQTHPDMFATRNTITALIMIKEDVSYYDDSGKDKPRWKTLSKIPAPPEVENCDFPEELDIPTLVVKAGHLYTAGLPTYSIRNGDSFTRYNSETQDWDDMGEIQGWSSGINQFSMVELHGYIYTIRAGVGYKGIFEKNVARYSIAADEWEEIVHMKEGIVALDEEYGVVLSTAIVFNGKILVSNTGRMQKYPTDDELLIIEMYDPATNVWHVVLKDKCPKRSQAILTVQQNICYLLLQPYMKDEVTRPKVYKLNCDFDADSPKACLGEVIQRVTLTNNDIGAFSINDDVFVNVWRCVYQLKTDDQNEVDISRWSDIIPDLEWTFSPVFYTFDKRLCT